MKDNLAEHQYLTFINCKCKHARFLLPQLLICQAFFLYLRNSSISGGGGPISYVLDITNTLNTSGF